MNKNIFSLIVCSSLMSICLLSGTIISVKGETLEKNVTQNNSSVFTMTTGASVRKEHPTGIRFRTTVSKDYIQTLTKNGESISYKTSFTIPGKESEPRILDAKKLLIDENGNTYFNSVIWNIPESEYFTEVTAKSFIEISNSNNELLNTIWVDNPQTRSVAYVAASELNTNPELNNEVLMGFLNGVQMTANAVKSEIVVTGETNINVSLAVGNKSVSLPVQYKNLTENIIEVTNDGKVTGKVAGIGKVNVVCGNISKEVVVTVVDNNVVEFKVNGEELSQNALQLYTVSSLGDQSYDKTLPFVATALVNGMESEVSVNTGNNILYDAEQKTISAVSHGNDSITISVMVDGTKVEKQIAVEVIRPVVEYAKTIEWFSAMDGELLKEDGTNLLNELFPDGNFSAVQNIQDQEKELTVSGSKLLGVQTERDKMTQTSFKLLTDTYGYIFNVEAYTKVISKVEDFSALDLSKDKLEIDGYFVLKNDILDMRATRNTASIPGLSGKNGFIGVFDGLGHTIDEYWVNNSAKGSHTYGFFYSIGPKAVIKNVSFTNLVVKGDDSRISMILSWNICTVGASPARIENVYMDVKIEQPRTKFLWVLGRDRTPYMSVENFILKINTPEALTTDTNGNTGIGLFGKDKAAGTQSPVYIQGNEIKNTYIIAEVAKSGRVFPLVQCNEMSVYAANDFSDIEHGTKIRYDENHNPVADQAGTSTLYRFKNVYRYDTFKQLIEANVTKVGNWSVTAEGVTWVK